MLPIGIDATKLDLELFNVDYLVSHNYSRFDSTPTLLTSAARGPGELQSLERGLRNAGVRIDRNFARIEAVSARVPHSDAPHVFSDLLSNPNLKKI